MRCSHCKNYSHLPLVDFGNLHVGDKFWYSNREYKKVKRGSFIDKTYETIVEYNVKRLEDNYYGLFQDKTRVRAVRKIKMITFGDLLEGECFRCYGRLFVKVSKKYDKYNAFDSYNNKAFFFANTEIEKIEDQANPRRFKDIKVGRRFYSCNGELFTKTSSICQGRVNAVNLDGEYALFSADHKVNMYIEPREHSSCECVAQQPKEKVFYEAASDDGDGNGSISNKCNTLEKAKEWARKMSEDEPRRDVHIIGKEQTLMRFQDLKPGERFYSQGLLHTKMEHISTDTRGFNAINYEGCLKYFADGAKVNRYLEVEVVRQQPKEKVFYEVMNFGGQHLAGSFKSLKEARDFIKRRYLDCEENLYIMKAVMKYEKPEDDDGFEELEE